MPATAESQLAGLAVGQWGMLTAAQASSEGIARSTLARREKAGTLERVRQGVYRLTGVPTGRLDDIRAAWLASDPAIAARDRVAPPDVVVGGAAAAWSHGIGDFYPAPYLLYTTRRRQTTHDDVRFSRRHLPVSDVMILDGLPVTTRERTIADLLDEGDLSTVADALRDAERSGNDLDIPALIANLDSHANRLGHANGADLYAELRTLAGVDVARLQDLLMGTDLAERLSTEIGEHMQRALAPLLDDVNARVASMFPDILGPIRNQLNDQADQLMSPVRSQLDDQMKRMTAPALEALRGHLAHNPPRVTLPISVLPQITLPLGTRTMLRDLDHRTALISAEKKQPPHLPRGNDGHDAEPRREDDE